MAVASISQKRRLAAALSLLVAAWLVGATCEARAQVAGEGERVTLVELTLLGNEQFSDSHLSNQLGVEVGDTVAGYQLPGLRRRIEDVYRQAGYPFIFVRVRLGGDGALPGEMTITIVEGPRVAVSRVRFEGNEHLDAGKMLKVMKTRARKLIPLFGAGWYKERVFRDDVKAVRAHCFNQGYLDAEVAGYISYNRDRDRVELRVAVREGQLYRLAAVAFEGNELFRDDELMRVIGLRIGAAYRPIDLGTARRKIARLYENIGHMDVAQIRALRAEPVIDPEKAQVTMRVRIDEGPLIRAGRVRIEGLSRTREGVVRRSLNIYPGQIVTRRRLRESEQLLNNSGYFSRAAGSPVSITVTGQSDGRNAYQRMLAPEREEVRDVIVRIREDDGRTGFLAFGAAVSSDGGLMGSMSLSMPNFDITNWPSSWEDLVELNAFRGGGQRLRLVLQPGEERSYYRLAFDEPAVGDGPYSFGFDLYARRTGQRDFDLGRRGLVISGGRRLSKFVSHSLGLGLEEVEISDVDAGAAQEIRRDEGTHLRPFLRYVVTTDRRDNRFSPTSGYYTRARLEAAFGDVNTLSLGLTGHKYWTVYEDDDGDRHVLAVRGRIGLVDAFVDDRVPVFERFFAGGHTGRNMLRGFKYGGVAPVDPLSEDQVGGESLLLGSVEYSLPVVSQYDMRLVAFSDFGYVRESVEDLFTGWSDLRLSVGGGVRFEVPLLGSTPIQLYLSLPVLKEDADHTQAFQFTFGAGTTF